MSTGICDRYESPCEFEGHTFSFVSDPINYLILSSTCLLTLEYQNKWPWIVVLTRSFQCIIDHWVSTSRDVSTVLFEVIKWCKTWVGYMFLIFCIGTKSLKQFNNVFTTFHCLSEWMNGLVLVTFSVVWHFHSFIYESNEGYHLENLQARPSLM